MVEYERALWYVIIQPERVSASWVQCRDLVRDVTVSLIRSMSSSSGWSLTTSATRRPPR